MTQLKVIGQNIQLNIAEKEWLGVMMRQFNCTEQEALAEIIEYKREQAFMYQQQGNMALVRQILQDIDEWDDTREADYQETEDRIEEFAATQIFLTSKLNTP